MQFADRNHPITAIVYSDSARFEVFLQETTAAMAGRGMRLAGLIQRSEPRPGRPKCDMHLLDLASGEGHRISDDRGPHARGCVLNMDRLLRACEKTEAGLSGLTDLLVLCKFGKAEVEGSGFRALIAKALERSVPVLIGVPLVNLLPFRAFSGEFARVIELSEFGSDPLAAVEIDALPTRDPMTGLHELIAGKETACRSSYLQEVSDG
ncbi:DUF2478 domain-containing protein [Roseiarcaceae bacterium H3SJ34-1]|uniref:DUF2478 domain-containing protein n=1 Tax=Terripilifer ovatus TaxID=3032367 RepID=UPI003AB924AD|nr:DUF2478 domain-containing protein [Roseiarcaceae bacterium H3SJ34-1]